jgi:hypothetical protein
VKGKEKRNTKGSKRNAILQYAIGNSAESTQKYDHNISRHNCSLLYERTAKLATYDGVKTSAFVIIANVSNRA